MPNQNIIPIHSGNPPKGGKSGVVEELLNVEALLKHTKCPDFEKSDNYELVGPLIIDAALARLEVAFRLFDSDPEIGPFEM
jgi:hypothetical protein